MTTTTEELKTQLAKLPAGEHAELARYLIDSLDEPADPEAEPAWDLELARRAEEIRNGTECGEPAPSVFARLRAKVA